MVQLPGGYFLGADEYAIGLYTQRESGRYDVKGYYTTLEGAIIGWTRRVERSIVGRKQMITLEEVLQEIQLMDQKLKATLGQAGIRDTEALREALGMRKTPPEADIGVFEGEARNPKALKRIGHNRPWREIADMTFEFPEDDPEVA
jgi:hypothetical protein